MPHFATGDLGPSALWQINKIYIKKLMQTDISKNYKNNKRMRKLKSSKPREKTLCEQSLMFSRVLMINTDGETRSVSEDL